MANGLTRLVWRAMGLVDLAVAVPLYFLVPRHVRFRWSAPGTVLRNRRGFDEVMRLVEPGRRAIVLDVGGGIAALKDLPETAERMWIVTLDIDMPLLQRARRKVPDSVLVCADGTRLPFRDGTFDAVVMVHALEHIPEQIRPALVSEIKRVSRRGVVIHGPAGADAVELARQFIAALEARGGVAPRYAIEHLEFPMPMPQWLNDAFPGCALQPRRNFGVELDTLLMAYTPVIRWFTGYRQQQLSASDDTPPFVEYTMTWRKPAADAQDAVPPGRPA
jgi:SAM-dependent methyltransferase